LSQSEGIKQNTFPNDIIIVRSEEDSLLVIAKNEEDSSHSSEQAAQSHPAEGLDKSSPSSKMPLRAQRGNLYLYVRLPRHSISRNDIKKEEIASAFWPRNDS